jgi:hypothetical protein
MDKRLEKCRSYETNWVKTISYIFLYTKILFIDYRSRFREVADIPRNLPLIFESHEDQESKRGATSKILFRA